ncbi:CRTAC1 family protein [bacterium]|nr:CRTAC1 family protein [bacterium]
MRRTLHLTRGLAAAALLAAALAGCGKEAAAPPPALFASAPDGDLPTLGATFGATLCDLDGDGDLDLLTADPARQVTGYRNDGDLVFTKVRDRAAISLRRTVAHGLAACDYDGDGDSDVFVGAGTEEGLQYGRNHLWRRVSDDEWQDVGSGDAAFADPIGRADGGLWADFDGDPDLELLVFNFESPVFIADRSRNGWRDISDRLPWPAPVAMDPSGPPPAPRVRARSSWIHTAAVVDLDGDGRQDLVAIGRPGWSGLLLRGDDGRFTDRTTAAGLRHALWPRTPRHVAVGDLDEDGRPDLVFSYLTADEFTRSYYPVEVWLNHSQPGAPHFEMQRVIERDVEQDRPLRHAYRPESTVLADLDNDGHLDLYVVQPLQEDLVHPNRLYRGRGDGTFTDATDDWGGAGPRDSAPESAWAADLDGDGDLDLVTLNGGEPGTAGGAARGLAVYRNLGTGGLGPQGTASEPADSLTVAAIADTAGYKGISITLVAASGPAHGIGARATLVAGKWRQTRWQHGVVSGAGTSVLPLHFGVGRTPGPYTLEITWADGSRQTVSILSPGGAYVVRQDQDRVAAARRDHEGGSS